MTPEEQDRYRQLTAELERLSAVKQELAKLAATVYAREGARSFQVGGEEVLLSTAKNGAPYFAARSRWAKNGKPKLEKPDAVTCSTPESHVPAYDLSRFDQPALVEAILDNVIPRKGRIIEATAVLRSSARVREQSITEEQTETDAISELRAAIAASTKTTTNKKPRESAPVFSDPDAEDFGG